MTKKREEIFDCLRYNSSAEKYKTARDYENFHGRFVLPQRGQEADMAQKRNRPDHDGAHRMAFERNKKKIYATQNTCGICGKPVDFGLRYPHPLSACIDHIIPVTRGGHPSDMNNLQLAHWACNRMKSDKLVGNLRAVQQDNVLSNRVLPQSRDWTAYRAR